jgi:Tol biopolymer transport system component
MQKAFSFLVVVACCFGAQAAPAFELLTRATTPVALSSGNGPSGGAQVSPDGNLILFMTSAQNLGVGVDARFPTLCLYNRTNATISAVPFSTNGGIPNKVIESYQFTDNGRKILFETRASNLVLNDTNTVNDVYLWDVAAQFSTLISVGTNGYAAGGESAVASTNGERIAFNSRATLDTNDIIEDRTIG